MLPRLRRITARKLLDHGADATVRDKDGRTPFDLALSRYGIAKVAHLLLQRQHGADPGLQSPN